MKLLKNAVNAHHNLMEAARNGNGIDRHLFGMWCAAYEADIEIPPLYDDVLYKKRYNKLWGQCTLFYNFMIICIVLYLNKSLKFNGNNTKT